MYIMKNSLQYSFLILTLFIMCPTLSAQNVKIEKADKEYNHYGYIDARNIYLEVAKKGFESAELYKKIANTYYFNADYKSALEWYQKFFKLEPNPEPQYFLRMSQSLKANGDNKQAKKYFNLFVEKSDKNLSKKELTAEQYLDLIEKNSERYTIKPLTKINTPGIDFGRTTSRNMLIYASTKDTGVVRRKVSGWDGLSFLDLYQVKIQNDSIIGEPTELPGDVNSKFHESSPAITKDGKTMYFTRSNITPDDRKKSAKLKIYRAHLIDGKWKNVEDLTINGETFSTAHPTLNPEGNTLFFASDRPDGFGDSDLYAVVINEDGKLGTPQNLGSTINTSGKETFPFMTKEHELYFSSNGHFGLGGLDVFYIHLKPYGTGNLLNIGKPINSYADDFAFGINFETKEGFFSSNRNDSIQKTFIYDDIYYLKENEKIKDLYLAIIYGTVTDKSTGEPLENSTITFFEPNDSIYVTLSTDKEGFYKTETDYFTSYRIRAEKEAYDSDEKVSVAEIEEQEINFQLNRNRLEIKPGDNLATLLNIQMIFFDFDKSNIRRDAQVELEKLITVLKNYPKLKIDIRSHTDSRGSDSYNVALSDRRAKSTLEYLVKHGIERERLTAKGYGETQLLNECSNGVPCSAAQHQLNRRSEFIIVE